MGLLSRSRIAIAAFGVALVLFGVACNDDDGGGPAATPTALAEVTPADPAIIDGQIFISTASGYRVEFPQGWTPDDNFLYTPDQVIDVFFGPAGTAEVQANIQIRCDRETQGFTSEEYIAARRQVAEGFAIDQVQEQASTVAGVPAVMLTYQQRPGGTTTVDKTDVIFTGHGCGWTISLTEDPSEDQRPQLDAMLATFTFVG